MQKNCEEYRPAVITERGKKYVIYFVRTFEQRHCFLYSPDLITNLMRLSNEDNNNKNMFRRRYGQQVDFGSDNADIQQQHS